MGAAVSIGPRLTIAQTDELGAERMAALTDLCEAAFDVPFAPIWDRVGPGIHVVADLGGRPVAHAMVVDRTLHIGSDASVTLDTGYVENVATAPDRHGEGLGSAVMREIGRIIGQAFALGALATAGPAFYARLGWETWAGATWVRMPDGQRVRSAEQDGHIMVLRTPSTPPTLDPTAPIAVDWRPGEAW
jgi:aminoglycoside 2'-N-acetyltransferase I